VNEKRNSTSISGAGSISGGTYSRVSISGSGRVTGDLIAEELRISGAGRIQGRTEVTQITASGSARFEEGVTTEEMRVSGSARVEGPLVAKELKTSGSLRVKGSVTGEYVKASGQIHVGGDLEADIFRTTGGFDIEGLLSADRIEVHLGGRCCAREIGGETIEIRRGGWKEKGLLIDGLVKLFFGSGVAELKTQQVEGDDILLEDTTADVVRGKRVEIGPGCHIGVVEYAESLKIHPDAEVGKQIKV
jgi:cytoskeletal protein CcmA (bactofilin family)